MDNNGTFQEVEMFFGKVEEYRCLCSAIQEENNIENEILTRIHTANRESFSLGEMLKSKMLSRKLENLKLLNLKTSNMRSQSETIKKVKIYQ